MKKRNLMFAATLSVCFAVSIIGNATLTAEAFSSVKANTTVILPDEGYPTSGQTGKGNGGAIINTGTLKNSGKVEFKNNTALSGGAIYNNKPGTVDLNNITFEGNKSNAPLQDKDYGGGAIFNSGLMTLSDSQFKNNIAKNRGGAIYNNSTKGSLILNHIDFSLNEAVKGGALYVGNKTTSEIINSTFENQTASQYGGGIYIDKKGTAIISSQSKFTNNTANMNGGGIYNMGTLTINDTEFTKNTANGNDDLSGGGGAVYNFGGSFEITDSKFTDNIAGQTGGAILNAAYGKTSIVKNTTFEGNYAKLDGGAVSITASGGDLIIDGSTFSKNHTTVQGGAVMVYLASSDTPDKHSNLTITNSKFNDNYTDGVGGGAISNYDKLTIKNSEFIANKALSANPKDRPDKGGGGALMLGSNSETYLDTVTFNGNKSAGNGGVIGTRFGGGQDNSNAKLDIYNSTFKNNEATGNGGVLDNHFFGSNNNEGAITIYNSTFEGNKADDGGAIYSTDKGAMVISQSTFRNNKATYDGAIAAGLKSGDIKISDSLFEGNEALSIGAIGTFATNAKMEIENTVFRNNKATDATDLEGGAGALFTGAQSQTSLKNVTFDSNYSAIMGGAIATRGNKADNSAAKLDIDGALFVNNVAEDKGGAIFNAFYDSEANPSSVSIKNAVFVENKSGADGGAIYNEIADQSGNIATVTITDSSFGNNTAAGKGGAIFANSDLTIEAINKDVVFAGNKAVDGGDIYMNKAGSTLKFDLDNEKVVTIKDGISGNDGKYDIAINGFGNIDLQSYIKNANVTVNDATLWLNSGSHVNGLGNHITMNNESELITINNQIDKFDENLFTLNGDVDLAVDVDLATGKTDFFKNSISNDSGKFVLEGVKPIANTTNNVVQINLYEALGLNQEQLTINPDEFVAMKALTPIRYLSGSVSENGILTYAPTGNSYKDFNPSVMASPVAAQLGGYLTQLNSYDEAFRNMDMYMLMTKKQRQAMKLRNKYAAADSQLTFSPPPKALIQVKLVGSDLTLHLKMFI